MALLAMQVTYFLRLYRSSNKNLSNSYHHTGYFFHLNLSFHLFKFIRSRNLHLLKLETNDKNSITHLIWKLDEYCNLISVIIFEKLIINKKNLDQKFTLFWDNPT